MSNSYSDLLIIGAGPGGYAAAFHAADHGLNVTLVDPKDNPGGVCLYKGCIPSKALLHAAKLIHETQESPAWGLNFGKAELDIDKLRDWKNGVVSQLTGGLGQLVKQRKINYIQGRAFFKSNRLLQVTAVDGSDRTIEFGNAIIATGSRPVTIPGIDMEHPNILNSTGALALESIPERLLVIGGGYIGLEMGTAYAAFGSRVTIAEMLPNLLPAMDKDLVRILKKSLDKKFEEILLSTKVKQVRDEKNKLRVSFELKDGSLREELFDKIIVSVGRRPNSDAIGLENTSVGLSEKGFILTDDRTATTVENIYAIGDIAGGMMLAHKASHEGFTAVDNILGRKASFNPAAIPAVVFTDPEIAVAGIGEDEAKAKGLDVEVTRFPWAASGRALTMARPDGLTKIIFDRESGRTLGVGIVGAGAGELIAEGTLAIEMAALASDVKLTIHAHPTLSETFMEAGELFFGPATHVYKPKRK